MAEYEYNGQRYELPDNIAPQRALELIQMHSGAEQEEQPASEGTTPGQHAMTGPMPDRIQAETATTPAGNLGPEDKIDPDTLSRDQDWLDASLRVWHFNNAGNFQGNASDLAEYGLDTMGWFNYNLPKMSVDAFRLRSADADTKLAFVHLMDTYDNLEMSWSGAGRFIKGVALDPTTYTGLASLGIGTVASSGAKLATKQGIKEILKAGIVGAIETGIMSGVQNSVQQDVRLNAGTQQDFDYGQLATNVGIGALAGETLGAASRAGQKLLGKESGLVARQAEREINPENALRDAQESVHGLGDASATTVAERSEKPVSANENPTITAANDNVVQPEDVGAIATPDRAAQEPKAFDPDATNRADTGFASNDNVWPEGIKPEVSPDTPNAPNVIIAAINKYAADTGARLFATGDQLAADSAEAIKVISNLKPDDAQAVVDEARMGKLGPEATMLAKNAFAQGTEKLGQELKANRIALDIAQKADSQDAQVIAELQRRADDLQSVYDTVRDVDLKFSSITGHELAGRVGMTNTGAFREISPDTILESKGLDPILIGKTHPERRAAEAEFQRKLAQYQDRVDADDGVRQLEAEADKLFRSGDIAGAIKKNGEAATLRDEAAKLLDGEAGKTIGERGAELANKSWKMAVEYVISTVFKTSTLLVNLVPHLILTPSRPAVEFLLRGGDHQAYTAMKAAYAAMYQHSGEALRAAVAAYRYEADLMAGHGVASSNKFLETSTAIPGRIGGAIRFFPRVLNATDQLFKRTNYSAYVASYAASDAFQQGLKAGWKSGDAEFIRYIQDSVKQALDHAFSDPSGNGNETIAFLRSQGLRRGIKPGPKLDQFIKQELAKNSDLFGKAISKTGLSFADDMAFRRDFSGEGFVSNLAKGYEGFVNNHPWMKFFGQLFFRTPVRVFEEGIRLTPGLNMVAPGFLRDLTGRGASGPGGTAQIRAQAEAMLSLAFAGSTFAAYANGKITGGGSMDWRTNKGQTATGFEPYTYTFDDGTHWSFRNFDPFATPFKIMVNALDRYTELEYRRAQGETIDQSDTQQAIAHVVVPALSIVQAIKDANLAEGLSELIDLGHDLSDPERNSDALQRFLAKKAQLAIPNQYTAMMQAFEAGGSNYHDPKTFEQYLLARVNPTSPYLPRRYDPLGNDLKNANPFNGLWGVPVVTTEDQRKAVTDEKSQAVNEALGALTVATGKSFIPGYTAAQWAAGSGIPMAGLSGMDVRETFTRDGTETLYDRLNWYVHQSDLKDRLYDFLVVDPRGTIGTPTASGSRTDGAMKLVQAFRAQAFARVMMEEGVFKPDIIQALQHQAESKAGLGDAMGAPFSPY